MVRFMCVSRAVGKSQSSVGLFNQAVSAPGTGREVASLSKAISLSVVVDFLVRLSARTADSVDILGRCCTVTEQPRKLAIR